MRTQFSFWFLLLTEWVMIAICFSFAVVEYFEEKRIPIQHVYASHIEIQVCTTANSVNLVIEDNGRGFNLEQLNGSGFGLQSMQQRVAAVDGNFPVKTELGMHNSNRTSPKEIPNSSKLRRYIVETELLSKKI